MYISILPWEEGWSDIAYFKYLKFLPIQNEQRQENVWYSVFSMSFTLSLFCHVKPHLFKRTHYREGRSSKTLEESN